MTKSQEQWLKQTKQQAKKAIASLHTWIGKEKKNKEDSLFEKEDFIQLVISLKKTQTVRKDKPLKIYISHPIYDIQDVESCLIVKDHSGEGKKEAKNRLEIEKVAGISKVIGLSKIKSKFPTHAEKRKFCASYNIFLADDRVLPLLPKLLGKTFFKKKKQPIPVGLRGKAWKKEIESALHSTFMYIGTGSCFTIRIATAKHNKVQIQKNLSEVLEFVVDHIPGSKKNIQSLYIKSSESISLPIFSSLVSETAEQET